MTLVQPTGDTIAIPGKPITLQATAMDAEDGDLSSQISRQSKADGVLGEGATITVILIENDHNIAASVTDSGGLTETQTIVIKVVDQLRVVTIALPQANAEIVFGQSVALEAQALDVEDGDLSSEIIWRSNRDGELGSGTSILAETLTAGFHYITAQVNDSRDQLGRASVRVRVRNTAAGVDITDITPILLVYLLDD